MTATMMIMIAMLAAHAGIQCQRVAAYCNSYVSFIQTTGAGALLRNHIEETALPFELVLAFLTTKKLD